MTNWEVERMAEALWDMAERRTSWLDAPEVNRQACIQVATKMLAALRG